MPDVKRIKPGPEEYEQMIAAAMKVGDSGRAEYLATRFDRDYPASEDLS